MRGEAEERSVRDLNFSWEQELETKKEWELWLTFVSPSIYECLCVCMCVCERERGGWWLPADLAWSNICKTFNILCCLVSSLCIQAGNEGSAENGQKETSTCDICQFGAECDVDAEDVWWEIKKRLNGFSALFFQFSGKKCLRYFTVNQDDEEAKEK